MISRYEATLNGVALSSLDANLLILDIRYPDRGITLNTTTAGHRDGSILTGRHVEPCVCSVSFELHIYGTKARQEALQRVIAWAKDGGILETSDRDGQELLCVCQSLPSITSVRNWTDPLTVNFVSKALPYWQESEATSLTLTGTEASGSMAVPGNGQDAFVNCEITAGGNLTDVTLSAGDSEIEVAGLNLTSGQKLIIEYDENQILSIKANGSSALSKRTAFSSDDLMIPCGKTSTISIVADVSVVAVFEARGNWQ